jgi:hypothetical protein
MLLMQVVWKEGETEGVENDDLSSWEVHPPERTAEQLVQQLRGTSRDLRRVAARLAVGCMEAMMVVRCFRAARFSGGLTLLFWL